MKIKDTLKNLWETKIPKAARYVIGLAAIPLLWYIGANILSGSNAYTFAMIFIILSMFAAMFFIIKKIPAPAERLKGLVWDGEKPPELKYYITTLVIMLLLPIGGLALNASMSDFNGTASGGLFGDFSHPVYYVIAAANSLLLMIPPKRDTRLRLLLFFLKAAGLPYILYFFVVFLPILPLGVLGLLFCGLGVLIFAPAAAAVWQAIHMFREWRALAKTWGHQRLAVVFLIGILTLPLSLTSVWWGDKADFQAAARYLDQADPLEFEHVNTARLSRALKNMKGSLQPARGMMDFSEGTTPILSKLYSRFVLDGKVVSQDNIMALENLFFDAGHDLSGNDLSDDGLVSNHVRLMTADSETEYDENLGVYRSWVNLTLKNELDAGNGEYVVSFRLPDGAYISDYYLDVAGVRKTGILADRRAAEFLYKKIVNTRKDPGLLRYIGRNTLELRVFPFGPGEQRKTGFEILHSEPFELGLGEMSVSIGGANNEGPGSLETLADSGQNTFEGLLSFDGGILLPAAAKKELAPAAVRKPSYYFLVDNSKNSDIKWLVSQVDAYTKKNNITEAEVLFVNYKSWFHTLNDMHEADYEGEFGYNLNLAMRMVFDRVDAKDSFPIIIAVSDNMPSAILPRNIYPISEKFPESGNYYALNHNLNLTPYSHNDNMAGAPVKEPVIERVLSYNGHLVADNGRSVLIFDGKVPDQFVTTGNQYKDALTLDAMQKKSLTVGGIDTLDLVRASFRFRILTPHTAFMVVETAAQEKELMAIQEKILNNTFDASLVTLDEPPLLLGILILAVVFLLNRRKRLQAAA